MTSAWRIGPATGVSEAGAGSCCVLHAALLLPGDTLPTRLAAGSQAVGLDRSPSAPAKMTRRRWLLVPFGLLRRVLLPVLLDALQLFSQVSRSGVPACLFAEVEQLPRAQRVGQLRRKLWDVAKVNNVALRCARMRFPTMLGVHRDCRA